MADSIRSLATRIDLRRILFLTDFSRPSEAALPFVRSIARNYGAVVNALHVLTPPLLVHATPDLQEAAVAADEELAQLEMQKLDSQLVGIPHETGIEWSADIWSEVERSCGEIRADLIIVGTHGRTGAQRLLLGSVAEEVFRKSSVPVLTIGPDVNGHAHSEGRFRNILLATDFGTECQAAARYAISFAQENQARLTLVHVLDGPRRMNDNSEPTSAAEILHSLLEIVPREAELWCSPEPVVEYGEPFKAILHVAKTRGADLIVLGVHSSVLPLGPTTRLLRSTAHTVVARSLCPVLTARS